MIYIIVVLAALGVAFANGANDNFKGVATLFGSGTTHYQGALWWATGTTFLGSITAMLLAGHLIRSFGGKGLIEDAVVIQPAFAAAVGLGTALTVLIATRIGMPVSTTHGLIGALLGTGWMAGSSVNWSNLGSKFLIPLMLSPVLALVITGWVYPVLRKIRLKLGITREFCICVGQETVEVIPSHDLAMAQTKAENWSATVGQPTTCTSRYQGNVMGVSAMAVMDRGHFLSSGILSFARGLNDTPKIAAMLLLAPAIGAPTSLILVGVMIALGGITSARRVAETMSQRITTMNHGQGLTANVVSGLIVIGASRMGLPVSTTHVSCGALFGLGAATGGAQTKTIVSILLSWLITLPLAAVLAATSFRLIGT